MTFLSLGSLRRRRLMPALATCRSAARRRQLLGHHDFRSARSSGHHVKLVHESAHQKNSPSRGTEQILFRERVRDIRKAESLPFIQHVNDQLVGGDVHYEVDLFVGALLVSVVKRVDHAFAHAHADAIAVILAKSRRFRHAQTHLLGEINALYLRLQSNFEVLSVWRHVWRWSLPEAPNVSALWVTQQRKQSQWNKAPIFHIL